jgi:tetratricopeptide (TPR) repeat protein
MTNLSFESSEISVAVSQMANNIDLEKEGQQFGSFVDQVLSQDATNVSAIFAKGVLYSRRGETKDAVRHFQKIQKQILIHENLAYSLGDLYLQTGDAGSALSIAKKLLRPDPGNESYLRLA